MNSALDQVKSTLQVNADETIRFIDDINETEDNTEIRPPKIQSLQSCMQELIETNQIHGNR